MSSAAFIQSVTLDRAMDFARGLGLDPLPFSRRNGLPPDGSAAVSRVANSLFADFLLYAAGALDDPHFGLKAGAAFHPSDLGAFGYLLMNAPSASEGLREAERLFAFQQDGGFFRTRRETAGEITLLYDGGDLSEGPARQDAECGLAMIHAINRRLIARRLTPRQIRLRALGPRTDKALEEHFGCPVEFGCPDNAIVYDADLLAEPIRNADPRLYRILSDFISREIADLPDRQDLIAEARWRIRRLMPEGRARLSVVASDMGDSPRTLQRRLKVQGATFAALVNAVRLETWKSEAEGSNGRELAASLGFSDESAFYKWRSRQRPEHLRA